MNAYMTLITLAMLHHCYKVPDSAVGFTQDCMHMYNALQMFCSHSNL